MITKFDVIKRMVETDNQKIKVAGAENIISADLYGHYGKISIGVDRETAAAYISRKRMIIFLTVIDAEEFERVKKEMESE